MDFKSEKRYYAKMNILLGFFVVCVIAALIYATVTYTSEIKDVTNNMAKYESITTQIAKEMNEDIYPHSDIAITDKTVIVKLYKKVGVQFITTIPFENENGNISLDFESKASYVEKKGGISSLIMVYVIAVFGMVAILFAYKEVLLIYRFAKKREVEQEALKNILPETNS